MAVAAKFRPQSLKWLFLLFAAALWCATGAEVRRVGRKSSHVCEEAPNWTATVLDQAGNEQQRNPMLENRGKVVLVAMTVASSSHSLDQALTLQSLLTYFHGISMSDVNFILVNSAEAQDQVLKLTPFSKLTIVQDNENSTVWSELGGKKDDVYIYDRCGRLTYAIPFPLSIIHRRQQVVESSVISTYLDDLCGDRKCSVNIVNASIEDSADTELLNTTHSTLVDVTDLVNITEEVIPDEEGPEELTAVGFNNSTDQLDIEDQSDRDLSSEQNNHTSKKFLDFRSIEQHQSKKGIQVNKKVTPTAATTEQPQLVKSLRSFYQHVLKYMPWATKQDQKASREPNYVQKFLDIEEQSNETATNASTETEHQPCSILQKGSCNVWTKKKLEHAQICCNLHACNRTTLYIQKHCKHYPEHRCKKVELVLRCCRKTEGKENGTDDAVKTRASSSSHPIS